jgi:outer membrane PBP1 activator LpoA protein
VTYPEMPWLPPRRWQHRRGPHADRRRRRPGGAPRSRLYAFGYDACQLALALRASGRDPTSVDVAGLTGHSRWTATAARTAS